MKFPSHIILDVKKNYFKNSSQYWIFTYFLNADNLNYLHDSFFIYKKFLFKQNKLLNKKFWNLTKFTVVYRTSTDIEILLHKNLKLQALLLKPRIKIKNKVLNKKNFAQKFYCYVKNTSNFDKQAIKESFQKFPNISENTEFKSSRLWNIFDINYLRKERIYTKLKYSRTPQYDMVSGGSAALFSGFLGFLICEKFGFELIDSGDFYFLFMYLVFMFFLVKLVLKLINEGGVSWNALSYKWFYNFYKTCVILLINSIKIKF